MTKLLRKGELDMAVLLTEGMIVDIINGCPAKILNVYVQSSLEWGIHVDQHSGLNALEEQELTYAISREGSGSHLMAMVNAKRNGWSLDSLDFKEVGSLAGALSAFERKEVDVFLWEKFTTDPYCVSGPLKRIGSLPTPWPCFVIAVNTAFYELNRERVDELVSEVLDEAASFKNHPAALSIITERYGLTVERAQKWFDSVEWGDGRNLSLKEIDTVLEALRGIGKVRAKLDPEKTQVLI